MSQKSRTRATWVLGVFMGGIAAVLIRGQSSAQGGMWLGLVAAGAVFGLLAALLLWSALRQTLAASIPTTIVEVDQQPAVAGESVQFCVKQPGPARLRSLRVNLVGLQRTESVTRIDGQTKTIRSPSKMFCHHNILDTGDASIPAGQFRQWTTETQMPAHACESGKQDAVKTTWLVEVWGKCPSVIVGFQHQFKFKVASEG